MSGAAPMAEPAATGGGSVCAGCGHAFDGLASAACPECGQSMPATMPEVPGPMGNRAAAGFAMMIVQSVATRIVSFLGQIVLAKVLMPEAFGLMALASAVLLVAGLVQQIGVREALLARQTDFARWTAPAFWMSTVTGVLAGAGMALAAPLVARFYGDERLTGLVLVLALSTPIASLAMVPEVIVQRELRFKFLAALTGAVGVATTALTVTFALLGFGAYSFVLPRVIVGIGRLAVLWRASGLRPGWRWGIDHWGPLAGASALVFASSVLMMVPQIGDVAILGKFRTPNEVGFYALALALSAQTVMTITQSLSSVMLPTLGRLAHDPERLRGAFLRTTRALAAKIAPACALQFFAAEPAMHAVFGHKWDASIMSVRVLSFGMVFTGAFIPVASLLQAQGRFKEQLGLSIYNVVLFVLLVPVGAWRGGVDGVAVAVSAYLAIGAIGWAIQGARPLGVGVGAVLDLVVRPAALAAIAGLAGWGASLLLPAADARVWHLARAGTMAIVTAAVYAPLLRLVMPETWHDVLGKVRLVLGKLGMARSGA